MEPVSILIGKLIAELPVGKVQEARVLLAKEQVEALEKQVIKLQEENSALADEVKHLRQYKESQTSSQKFVEIDGVSFKRQSSGGYSKVPYCPSCEMPMTSMANRIPFICGKCGYTAPFDASELDAVFGRLV